MTPIKNVAIVAGTRPEVIKMAPIYRELKNSTLLRPIFVSTAQHREMLDQALGIFGITPDFDMNIMQQGQTLTDLTARLLIAWKDFFSRQPIDAILVQGDTTTVLASALAAFYERIPIGHVEAGLRTWNMQSPWPEEMNRRLTDPLARWCFAPTEFSQANLIAEKIPAEQCFVTGNTVVDSLLWVRERIRSEEKPLDERLINCGVPADFYKRFFQDKTARWILITGHRRESFGSGFESICDAIERLSEAYPDVGMLYPVHMNPRVRETVERRLGGNPRISLIPPVDYRTFITLMDRCYFVLSDSGGVQEEAPSLGKPVLVMRQTTERPEGVQAGTCRLVGTDADAIFSAAAELLTDPAEYARRSALKNPYGDGHAARRIREILERECCHS